VTIPVAIATVAVVAVVVIAPVATATIVMLVHYARAKREASKHEKG
jgi:heme/copper-type cytochrome/quinol oxidase subunit 2